MSSSITPTIGRKVWFWASEQFIEETGNEPLEDKQPFDATVVFVYRNGLVNLSVTTHEGETGFVQGCKLRDPAEDDEHGGEYDFATWAPHQVEQAKDNQTKAAGKPFSSVAAEVKAEEAGN